MIQKARYIILLHMEENNPSCRIPTRLRTRVEEVEILCGHRTCFDHNIRVQRGREKPYAHDTWVYTCATALPTRQ